MSNGEEERPRCKFCNPKKKRTTTGVHHYSEALRPNFRQEQQPRIVAKRLNRCSSVSHITLVKCSTLVSALVPPLKNKPRSNSQSTPKVQLAPRNGAYWKKLKHFPRYRHLLLPPQIAKKLIIKPSHSKRNLLPLSYHQNSIDPLLLPGLPSFLPLACL